MNELRARVISQEKGIYKIQSGTAVKPAEISGKYRYCCTFPSPLLLIQC